MVSKIPHFLVFWYHSNPSLIILQQPKKVFLHFGLFALSE